MKNKKRHNTKVCIIPVVVLTLVSVNPALPRIHLLKCLKLQMCADGGSLGCDRAVPHALFACSIQHSYRLL